ncbi:MAG: phage terminase small subunit [Bacillus sp. (in: firmicutes)]|jgi:phage terminase small subunit|nr:phage terminase small subunit [Bacillus sp. (in: firmicutes)]
MSKLTEKQKRFADYYIQTGNATESARRAGYKQAHVQGSQNLDKLSVKNYIDERLRELEDKRIAKADEVLQMLTRILRDEEEEEVVVVEGDGEGRSSATTITKKVSAKDRIKAAELLGKRYGTWLDRQEISGNVGVQIVDDLGDDE